MQPSVNQLPNAYVLILRGYFHDNWCEAEDRTLKLWSTKFRFAESTEWTRSIVIYLTVLFEKVGLRAFFTRTGFGHIVTTQADREGE